MKLLISWEVRGPIMSSNTVYHLIMVLIINNTWPHLFEYSCLLGRLGNLCWRRLLSQICICSTHPEPTCVLYCNYPERTLATISVRGRIIWPESSVRMTCDFVLAKKKKNRRTLPST